MQVNGVPHGGYQLRAVTAWHGCDTMHAEAGGRKDIIECDCSVDARRVKLLLAAYVDGSIVDKDNGIPACWPNYLDGFRALMDVGETTKLRESAS
jgi:hypothetical protein